MKIGLIDVDGHHFPNLALMRISAFHKSIGDDVEWWDEYGQYDRVYMSKIFSSDYSKDIPDPPNAKEVYRGGTGYAITLTDGREHFDKSLHKNLPIYIEKQFPDYSIYPEYNFAVSMTSRGCPRGCSFCHVAAKEGRCSVKVADVSDFYAGQPEIKILDPNITACPDKRDLMRQYRETGALLDFTQGLDIRCINEADIDDLNHMRIKRLHFAWDNPMDDLLEKFKNFTKLYKYKDYRRKIVYVLTNFNSTMEQNLFRIYSLVENGFQPYVMVYDKVHAPKEIRDLQRWCNNRFIFHKCPDFYNYKREVTK